jgi:hypothetical protein
MLQRTIQMITVRVSCAEWLIMRLIPDNNDDQRSVIPSAWAPAIFAAGIMAIGALSTLLVVTLDALRPAVGDMVVLRPGPGDDSVRVVVQPLTADGPAASRDACVFDTKVARLPGGSLIVEARRETSPPTYQLHWSGGQTAAGADTCGSSADLTIGRIDLQKLANASGGFGLRHLR